MVEMNTTPLIDVMLVLLVMLIITIPMQLHSVPLDMPSSSSNAQPELVRVQIDAGGFVRWNGELITSEATLDERLRQAAQLPRQPEIHITPEPNTPYALCLGRHHDGFCAEDGAAAGGSRELSFFCSLRF
jgi:biopolymer transport protein ExbD